MSAIDRLYDINNYNIKKSVNIDDSLYEKLIKLSQNKFDATISELINICLEDYIERNKPSYYAKPKNETVTYRSIMLRKDNLDGLKKLNQQTGITITRLMNSAINEFFRNYKF